MGSLVDPSYELVDPTPDVHALFVKYDRRFFDGRLAACEVKWSPRMTTCAGICCYEGRSGLCSIKLSTPLLKLRPRSDLVETLLHEMIHAFLFVTVRDRDRDGHGPQFQWHMHRINKEAGTRITIYHSFHAEVAVYKNHHWRCTGPCRERRPFFGWVKRASNRAPSKNDLWWAEHERSCGGKFEKVSEPKEYTEKREKAEKKKAEGVERKRGGATAKGGGAKTEADDSKKQPKIDVVFGGGGTKLGAPDGNAAKTVAVGGVAGGGGGQMLGGGAGRSRLLDLFGGGARSTVGKENRSTIDDDDDEIMVIEAPAGPPSERPRLRGGSEATKWNEQEKNSDTSGVDGSDSDDPPEDLPIYLPRSTRGPWSDSRQPTGVNTGGSRSGDSTARYSPVHPIDPTTDRPSNGAARNHRLDDDIEFMFDENQALRNVDFEGLAEFDDYLHSGSNRDVDNDVGQFLNYNSPMPTLERQSTPPNESEADRVQRELDEKRNRIGRLFDEGKEAQGWALMEECELIEARLNQLRDDEELAKLIQKEEDEKDANAEALAQKILKDCVAKDEQKKKKEEEEIEDEVMPSIPHESSGERMDARGDEREEEREEIDAVRRMRREGGRRRRETEDNYWESAAGAEAESAERNDEEEVEVEMETVMIVRRVTETIDMDIGEWMLARALPRAEPSFVPVGTLEMPVTRVREEWREQHEQWKSEQSTPPNESEADRVLRELDEKRNRIGRLFDEGKEAHGWALMKECELIEARLRAREEQSAAAAAASSEEQQQPVSAAAAEKKSGKLTKNGREQSTVEEEEEDDGMEGVKEGGDGEKSGDEKDATDEKEERTRKRFAAVEGEEEELKLGSISALPYTPATNSRLDTGESES